MSRCVQRSAERSTAVDLFAGARGWEALSTDLVDAVGIELDPNACATSLAAGFRAIQADVATIDPRMFGVDGLIASPPCQTFSMAGAGAGRKALDVVLQAVKEIGSGEWPTDLIAATGDVRTGLVLQPLRWALAMRPRWISWEQVPAVLPVWEACADVLRAEGYTVATGVLNAEQYGVPQTRRRAVLIASRTRAVELPRPTHSRYYSHDPSRLDPGVSKWVSMAEALGWADGDIEAVKNMGRGMVERHGDRPGRPIDAPSFTIRASAGGTEPGGFTWALRSNNRPNGTERPADTPAPTLHFGERVNTVEWHLRATNARPNTALRPASAPAPTLAFGHSAGEWDNGTERRQLTIEEAATLQTFPHRYPFQGPKTKRFLQVGNAVPPILARKILEAVL